MCRESLPESTWIYWFLFLLQMACLPIALATQKPFLVYFQSVIHIHHFSNWQSMVVLLIKTKKNSLYAFPLLIHSLWIFYSIWPRIRKPDSALDWKGSHIKLYPWCHFIAKCGAPVEHLQIACCENHLDIIKRHSIQWLPCYIQWDFQWRKIVNAYQYSCVLK